jgi:hypothetical protein
MEQCSTTTYLSLKEYQRIAERILTKHFGSHVHDPDIFDIAVSSVIKADEKFNGKGSLHGFRSFLVCRNVGNMIKKPIKTVNASFEFLDRREAKEESDLFEIVEEVLRPELAHIINRRHRDRVDMRELSRETGLDKNTLQRQTAVALKLLRRFV